MAAKVRIEGTDRVIEAREGEDLLEVLQSHDVPIATSCGGVATCGSCRIRVVAGMDNLTPIRMQELVHLGNVAKITAQRLACQSKVRGSGEIVIDIPPVEAAHARRSRKPSRNSKMPPAPRNAVEWRPRVLDKKKDDS
ncbi:MAG TPA: 2Fe-2S iron-sulfur cluster-binding protein [Polyangiaceae bacterium]